MSKIIIVIIIVILCVVYYITSETSDDILTFKDHYYAKTVEKFDPNNFSMTFEINTTSELNEALMQVSNVSFYIIAGSIAFFINYYTIHTFNSKIVNDGKWHTISFALKQNKPLLLVDNQPNQPQSTSITLTDENVYIGGFKDMNKLHLKLFSGKIKNVTFGNVIQTNFKPIKI